MLRNYLKIAWRNLMKNKVFSFINIFGLAIGLTCCMLISLYLVHEISYDKHHKNRENIYQLGTNFIKVGNEDRTANTPAPMASMMQQEYPEIIKAARIVRAFSDDKTLLQYQRTENDLVSFYEEKAFLADSAFFQILTYDFIEGNPDKALLEPNTVVLSEQIAGKLFGKEEALNKVIHISSNTNGDHDFKVTGVFKPQGPTHIDANFFMSIAGGRIADYVRTSTGLASNNMYHTYLQLRPDADAAALEAKFPAFIEKYAGADLKAAGFYKKQFLTNIKDVYLFSNTRTNVSETGSVTYLYILASIAIFTLLIACINFMNLSTARSSKRSAEVGVRKVLGAERGSLIRQFLGESVLMALIAFAFSLAITSILLPAFRLVSGRNLLYNTSEYLLLGLVFFAIAILTGLFAGLYPAFYLSSFKPIKVLKGKVSNTLAAVSLRKALVIFQFVISVVLIVASVVINRQMTFLRSKDLGFTKDQQVVIPMRSNTSKDIYQAYKTELTKNAGISSVGATINYPGIQHPSDWMIYAIGGDRENKRRTFMNWVDDSFLQTLDIKPIAGRIFSKEFPADTNYRMVMNEEAVKQLGFKSPADAIGKFAGLDWRDTTYRFEIIGVVKDFHFQSLYSPIEPYAFQLNNEPRYNYIISHIKSGEISSTLSAMETLWRKLNPNEPFEYSFIDQDFMKNYRAETRLAAIVRYFTIIAILICCLGLFGLATFSAEQRTKEIGVRKVLGASEVNIVTLLSKDFLKLVAVAIIIASPIAWLAMNKWLEDFAYRTDIGWLVFVITAAIAICIALLTIGFQAIRAAVANPVKSLRTE